jgi:hypothetical protein
VRDGLLSGAEAERRVDGWVRAKQVEMTGDVLIITGRGAGSVNGIAVVRDATLRRLRSLKRGGVITAIAEDTPGSFIVTLASIRTMLEAPNRRRRGAQHSRAPETAITGLSSATHARLRELAIRTLESLGMRATSESVVGDEMVRQFSRLVAAAPAGMPPDKWLASAVERVIREYEDGTP